MTPEELNPKDKLTIPEELPIFPSGDAVLYPSIIVPLSTADEAIVRLINDAAAGNKMIGFFSRRPDAADKSPSEGLYSIGTAGTIIRLFKLPDNSIRALVQGISRIRLLQLTQTEPYLKGRVEAINVVVEKSAELEAQTRHLLAMFQKAVDLAPNLPQETGLAAASITDPDILIDFIAADINLKSEEGQEILETISITDRIKKLTTFLAKELEILELGSKLQSQVKQEIDKNQREFLLREQLKAIQKELGETDERSVEINELKQKIEEAKLPPDVQKEAERELERITKMPPSAAEYTVPRTYLDWLVSLPWAKSTEDKLDIVQAEKVLDEDHYDLEKVKGRILDFLAVLKLKKDMKGPILCFVGPPGTGKTSMGQSIARALGRKFVRLSLGGVRDEADIRGHRRTYIGALPGRIIQSIRRAESNNPVMMLDEIDKLGADFRGDPSAALLEVLDPAQNSTFVDHYLDVPFDLSTVLFITTANVLDTIPPALLDRMEVLYLTGYTEQEKLHIARKYLVPRQIKENGLSPDDLSVDDQALRAIIIGYTREAGVRNLEREIGSVCRKVARRRAEGSQDRVAVDASMIRDYLGTPKFHYDVAEGDDEVGVATGLAWTPAGGDVLFVEVSLIPGKGGLILTGKLGDVMQESARAAVTYARSIAGSLGVPENFFEKQDIHIHVPAGAIPKDGPSAGVTMTIAMLSAVTGRPVIKTVAMTGEVTLRGKVLPVGGIKEKVLAAHRAGAKKVILPKENKNDLEEVPQQIKDELSFVFVSTIAEAIDVALKKKKRVASTVRTR